MKICLQEWIILKDHITGMADAAEEADKMLDRHTSVEIRDRSLESERGTFMFQYQSLEPGQGMGGNELV